MTFIRNCRAMYIVGELLFIEWGSLVYLKLNPSISPLAMKFVASSQKKDFTAPATQKPQFNLCTDPIRLLLSPGLRGFCDWPFIWCDTFFGVP